MAATPPSGSGGYVLGTDPSEQARLRRQSAELADQGRALLERIPLGAGQRAIDLGCGPSGLLELLSDRVGSNGLVFGVDCDPSNVNAARNLARDRGLANARILVGDARSTGLPSDVFDLVHARFLLLNIPRPEEVICEMTRLAKPGGWVASQEPDVLLLCEPPHRDWQRLVALFEATYLRDGADPRIGRRLPELFRDAGLEDVRVALHADHHTDGDTRHSVFPDVVKSLRAKLIERRLAGETELDTLDESVRAHLRAPGTMTVPHLLFSVWGRKPC